MCYYVGGMAKWQTRDVVNRLLEKAEVGELREFVRQKARKDAGFEADLSEWLSNRYEEHGRTAERYVDKVQWLFQRVVLKNKRRARRCSDDDFDVNWGKLESGMLDIVAELEACVADGILSVVVEPIIVFYQRFHWCCENCLIDQNYDFCDVHYECEELLMDWIQHPSTDDDAKRELLCKLQQIGRLSTYSDYDMYGVLELTTKLTSMLETPEEALAHIDRLLEKDPDSVILLQKKIEQLRKMGRGEQASACIRQKLHVRWILEDELRRLCAVGEPGEARKLVEEAILRDFLPDSYLLERRIDIMKLQGDTDGLIKAYYDFLTTEPFYLEYYRELKSLLSGDEWQRMYADMIKTLKNKKNNATLECIYDEESDMEAMYRIIQADNRFALSHIMKYFKRMPEKYHESLLRQGIAELKEQSVATGTRSDYADYAKRLKRFSLLPGAAPLVADLLTYIRATYPRRKAMLEVLSAL